MRRILTGLAVPGLVFGLSCVPLTTADQPFARCAAPGAGCASPDPSADPLATVFLIGDAGQAGENRAHLLRFLSEELAALRQSTPETWVVFLGDNIYEEGLRRADAVACEPRRDEPFCEYDLEQLDAQLDVARRPGVRALFLPGNHDWADRGGEQGFRRIVDQAAYVSRPDNTPTRFAPVPGCFLGAPIDIGPAGAAVVRIIPIDTHLWILQGDVMAAGCPAGARDSVRVHLTRMIRDTPPRTQVVIAAHHPLVSGSKHGGNRGMLNLVNRAGLIVQDLNAGPYRDWIALMHDVVRDTSRRLVYVAGHDHALQVVTDTTFAEPVLHVLSGSGSKLSPVAPVEDAVNHFAAGLPGYVRLEFLADGSLQFRVVAVCADAHPSQRPLCTGTAAVQTVYAELVAGGVGR